MYDVGTRQLLYLRLAHPGTLKPAAFIFYGLRTVWSLLPGHLDRTVSMLRPPSADPVVTTVGQISMRCTISRVRCTAIAIVSTSSARVVLPTARYPLKQFLSLKSAGFPVSLCAASEPRQPSLPPCGKDSRLNFALACLQQRELFCTFAAHLSGY